MKRTTYIVLGLFITGWICIIANYVVGHIKGSECAYRDVINVPAVQDSIDVAGIKVINVTSDSVRREVYLSGDLILKDKADSSKCYFPSQLSKYFSLKRTSDTLNIHFHLRSAIAEAKDSLAKPVYISGVNFSFSRLKSLKSIMINAKGMGILFDKIKLDSLSVSTKEGSMKMHSSVINSLMINEVSWFEAQGCTIGKLYLDLDPIHSWKLENCSVEEEHLTGSGEHTNQLQKGEAKFVFWKPKKEDASLNLQLKEYSKIEIGQH